MIYKVYDNNNYIVRHAGFDIAQRELLSYLWLVYVFKTKNYKVKYNYNYSNKQTITFIDKSNNFKHEFSDVPVKMGILDIDELKNEIKGGE
jgi:hypothetical protein